MLGLFSGCLVFFVGDELIGRMGGAERKKPTGTQVSGNGLGIVLGAVLDGVPESMVIGLTLIEGGSIGVAYITAVFLSNLPEGISATRGLTDSGWARGRVLGLWAIVVAVAALASLAGYTLLEGASDDTVAFVQTFAGGAILTMLATTMMPEAYEHGGNRVGIATTLGFATAYAIHVLACARSRARPQAAVHPVRAIRPEPLHASVDEWLWTARSRSPEATARAV